MPCDYLFSCLEREFFSRKQKILKKNDFWEIFSNLFFSLSSSESYKFCYKYLSQYDNFLINNSSRDLLSCSVCENSLKFSNSDLAKKSFFTKKYEEEDKNIQFLFDKLFENKSFQDPFILLNWLMMDSYYFVNFVDDNKNHTKNNIYLSDSLENVFYNNTVVYIRVKENVSNSIFFDIKLLGDSFSNVSFYFDLGKNANLKVYSVLQSYPSRSINFLNFVSQQSLGACLELYNLSISEGNIRNNVNAFLLEKRSSVKIYSLSHVKNNGYFDLNTNVLHCADDSCSSQLYKGVLEDTVETVFYGNVYIQEHIKNIEASQSSKVLPLSDTSKIHVKPQLNIFSDDVRCSHQASICQLDPDIVFYMASRGLTESLIKILFIKSFYSEMLETIDNKDYRNKFWNLLSKLISG